MKTQATNNVIPETPKEGKHSNAITKKKPGINNHWSLISLNISELKSLMKGYRLTEWIQK